MAENFCKLLRRRYDSFSFWMEITWHSFETENEIVLGRKQMGGNNIASYEITTVSHIILSD